MDLDEKELTNGMIEKYKDKSMFKEFDYYDYIVSIYNDKNFDEVLIKLGYNIDPKNKVKSYTRVFPGNNGDYESFVRLKEKFQNCKNSNLINLLNYLEQCIERNI